MKTYKPFNTCPYCGIKIIPSWKFCDSKECWEKEKERRQKVAHYVESIMKIYKCSKEEAIEQIEINAAEGSF